MGCGGSRMDPEREAMACKFPPRLRLRFEEIKRKRIATATEGTLSKKKLLKEGDHSVSQASADDKSLSSLEESMRTAKIAPEPESAQEEEEEDNNNAVEEETDNIEKEVENEEEGRINNVGDGYYLCPGSPSFRVYCADALESIISDSMGDADTKEKPYGGDSGEIVAPLNFNEEVSDKAIEKGEKGKRHRKRKSVKHLLKIKACSCYYPSCTGHHNVRLLTQKTAA